MDKEFDENKVIGEVIQYFKNIEYQVNCIIINYFNPKNEGVFSNVLLNNSITHFGGKLKVIKTICKLLDISYDYTKLYRLTSLRNIFAHESTFIDTGKESFLLIDELKSNGGYNTHKLEELRKEFSDIYKEEIDKITKLAEDVSKKCQNT